MSLQLSLIIKTDCVFLVPRLYVHLAVEQDDFSVISVTWLWFNIMFTTHELLSSTSAWRSIVANLVDDNREAMQQLDALVTANDQYTEEQFMRKARYIVISWFTAKK